MEGNELWQDGREGKAIISFGG